MAGVVVCAGSFSVGFTHDGAFVCGNIAHYLYFIALWSEKAEVEDTKLYACVTPLALALRAIVIGIRAMLGAVIAGSVVRYEEILHCDFSCVVLV